MPIVLFDLDNTLVDRDAAFAEWAEEFCATWGLPAEAHASIVATDGDGMRPRDEFLTEVRDRFDLAATVGELERAYHRDYPATFTFPDTSRSALRRLRSAGWKIGIVTNGPRSQEQKLEITRLGDEVDAVCISALVGSWKPDPGIFVAAAQRCGTDLDGWMVGDSGAADIRGGQAVGLRTIWIHRGREWVLGDPSPDVVCPGVVEAVAIILGEDGPG